MSLPNTSFHSDSNFESAVQDLEQEKKMVAALKRLSIGHMMQYDPDLPPGSMDDIDPLQTITTTAIPLVTITTIMVIPEITPATTTIHTIILPTQN